MSTARYFLRFRHISNTTRCYLKQLRCVCMNRFRIPRLSLYVLQPFVTVQALSFGFGKQKEESKEKELSSEELVIVEADKLHLENEILKLYEFLIEHKGSKNDEILWRLARATCDKGKLTKDPNEKKVCFFEAFDYVKRALELNDNNFASHKWYAILLDYTGECEGKKQRISNAFHVKEHFQKAISLNPKDSTAVHSLGVWCFLFADMPWYTRKIASALFAAPPTSTYEEALSYFIQAEETDPNFYSMNLLMLGKTYVRMKNYKMALKYLTKAKDYPVKTPDDQQAHKEALELLKSIGVKLEEQ